MFLQLDKENIDKERLLYEKWLEENSSNNNIVSNNISNIHNVSNEVVLGNQYVNEIIKPINSRKRYFFNPQLSQNTNQSLNKIIDSTILNEIRQGDTEKLYTYQWKNYNKDFLVNKYKNNN